MSQWQRLANFLLGGERACRIAIIEVEGSSPREVGASMLVTSSGGFTGTIGGGALEWQALALAQRLLAEHPEGKGIRRAFSLGPDLGQCCGGRVTLLFEAFTNVDLGWIADLASEGREDSFQTVATMDARGIFLRKIYRKNLAPDAIPDPSLLTEQHGENRIQVLLFGAGHVGRALVLALAPLPFSIRWIDTRPEAFPAHHPANTTLVFTENPVEEVRNAPERTLLLAITHSHSLDLDLVAAGLSNPAIAFTGMIGSATKRARFVSRLRAMGLPQERIDTMICPIGSKKLAGKEPSILAAGIAVQLLEVRQAFNAKIQPAAQGSQPRNRTRIMPLA